MCNRPSNQTPGFWIAPFLENEPPNGKPPSEMNISNINAAIVSANNALRRATYLKELYRNQTIDKYNSNPEELGYEQLENYSWLPSVYKTNSSDFEQHLKSLNWQKALLDLFTNIQKISVPLEQLVLDFNNEPLGVAFREMEGAIAGNVLYELHACILDNNLHLETKVDRDIMPDHLRNLCNDQSGRIMRDWVILRELVNILDYTHEVCKYLGKRRT